MTRERTTLEERGTWEFVPRSSIGRHRPLRCKYVYRKKLLKDGSIQYKSRLVGCVYLQVAGVNYSRDKISAGVISYSSVRFLMSLACQKCYILSQANITGVYLEIYLRDEVYMDPPPDMRGPDGGPLRNAQGRELVCRLKRSLFGLKQSGHAWSKCLHEFLLKDPKYAMGFTQFIGEPNIFRKSFRALWQAVGTSSWGICRGSSHLFLIRRSSVLVYEPARGFVLSMQIRYDRNKGLLQFDQRFSITSLAVKYGVKDLKRRTMPITPAIDLPKLAVAEVNPNEYLSIIGSCLHILQVSRPDIAHAVGVLSRHSSTPGQHHMETAINLVCYLYHTQDLFVQYTRAPNGNNPHVYEKD